MKQKFACLIALTLIFSNYQFAKGSLVAEYSFEEGTYSGTEGALTISDSSGNGNDGTIKKTGTTVVVDEDRGSVLNISSESSGGMHVDIDLPEGDKSVAFWCKTADRDGYVFDNQSPRSTLSMGGSTSGMYGYSYNGSGWCAGTIECLSDDQWHHYAFTLNHAETVMTVYLDGSELETISIPTGAGAMVPASTTVFFSRYSDNMGVKVGSFDDLSVYDHVLSAVEVSGMYLGGSAVAPTPEDGETGVDVEISALSWGAPGAYENGTYDVYFGTVEPNELLADYGLTKLTASPISETSIDPMPAGDLEYNTKYYWIVDSFEPGNSEAYQGKTWSFVTALEDRFPVVTPGSSYITWPDILPQTVSATVDDNAEGDIADVTWTISGYPDQSEPAAMQLLDRGMTSEAAIAQKAAGFDPNMLCDFIGTDSRSSDPMTLTLTGLPAGSYTWTSVHHDLGDQTGKFDVYVDGVLVDEAVDISASTEEVTVYTTTLTSDGTNPIALTFDTLPGSNVREMWFVMNCFELTNGVDTMKVDFTATADPQEKIAPGYQGYLATHEAADSFTAQDFSFGSATVTIAPAWDPMNAGWITASIESVSGDVLALAATFTTNYAGDYELTCTVTDASGQSDSATVTVQVVEDACVAASMSSDWKGYNSYDIDENCVVDLSDFALFAAEWLEDMAKTEAVAY